MRAFFVLIAVTTVTATGLPKDDKEPDYFPVKEGSFWEYNTGKNELGEAQIKTLRITKVMKEKETLVVKTEEKIFGLEFAATVHITKDKIVTSNQVSGRSGFLTYWKIGAKKGDFWEDKLIPKDGNERDAITIRTTVGQIEEVTVPAGKFQAQTLTSVLIPSNPKEVKANPEEAKVWLADGVGIVRMEHSRKKDGVKEVIRVIELNKYTPAK